jgi:hypothetical protein
MCTTVDGVKSSIAPVLSGVPQGTVLGPLLFIVYINDIDDQVSQNTRVKCYADDTLVYRSIRNDYDEYQFQCDLDHIQAWAFKWLLNFNAKKCVHMRVSPHARLRDNSNITYTLNLGRDKIPKSPSARYLGVTLSADLKIGKHVSETCAKADGVIGFLRRNLGGAPRKAKLIAYTALVRSRLEYASAATDPFLKKDIDALEMSQRRGIRFVCGDYGQRSSVTDMRESLGLELLADRRENRRKKILVHSRTRISHLCCAEPVPPNCSYTIRQDFLSRTTPVLEQKTRTTLALAIAGDVCHCYGAYRRPTLSSLNDDEDVTQEIRSVFGTWSLNGVV